jgi:hypothetical protein
MILVGILHLLHFAGESRVVEAGELLELFAPEEKRDDGPMLPVLYEDDHMAGGCASAAS